MSTASPDCGGGSAWPRPRRSSSGRSIGVGIFLTPGGMARPLALAGAGCCWSGWSWAAWRSAARSASASWPRASRGGRRLRLPARGLRPAGVAFLYGWKCLLVMDPGLTAALATGLGAYAAVPCCPALLGRRRVAIAAIVPSWRPSTWPAVRLAAGIGSRPGSGSRSALLVAARGLAASARARATSAHFVPFVARQPGAPPLAARAWPAPWCRPSSPSAAGGRRASSRARCAIRSARCRGRWPWASSSSRVIYMAVSAVVPVPRPPRGVGVERDLRGPGGRGLFGAAGGRVCRPSWSCRCSAACSRS